MLGFYNYTVVLTYIGMLSGFFGILYIFNDNIPASLICLVMAGICDMFDGKIASTMDRTKQEKRFGVQIDSLSDLVCFGVLPVLIVYSSGNGKLRWFPSAFYLLCALIRLAWYNVDEEERQEQESGRRKAYLGLPVTSSALIFPVLFVFGRNSPWLTQILSFVALLMTGLAFLTPFRVKKPSFSERDELPFRIAQDHETDPLAEAK